MQRRIRILAHNIRSLWNVGSLFRTADALGVEMLYLSGYTACPPRREISKTAIGAERFVPWEAVSDPAAIIAALKKDKWSIVALETSVGAVELHTYIPDGKICLIVGHEVTGIAQELLGLSDVIVRIPMHGKKESLNVAVAAGIALHHFRNFYTQSTGSTSIAA